MGGGIRLNFGKTRGGGKTEDGGKIEDIKKKADSEEREDSGNSGQVNGFTKKVHPGKQGKHIPGHNNYEKGKSIFNGTPETAQELVNKYAGTGAWKGSNKEVVDFGQVIGFYIDKDTGKAYETTRGTIHYSTTGAHIVPAAPKDK